MKVACPACFETSMPGVVETHFDPVGGKEYRILCCGACGVVFSEPPPVGKLLDVGCGDGGFLALARRLLFGRERAGTITSLYAGPATAPAEAGAVDSIRAGMKQMLADKVLRQRMVNAFKMCCSVFVWPIAAAMTAHYRTRRRACGDCLFTLARLERKP